MCFRKFLTERKRKRSIDTDTSESFTSFSTRSTKARPLATALHFALSGSLCEYFLCQILRLFADDPVYMEDEIELDEYVMAEKGHVFVGNSRQPWGRPWQFGQVMDFMQDSDIPPTHQRVMFSFDFSSRRTFLTVQCTCSICLESATKCETILSSSRELCLQW